MKKALFLLAFVLATTTAFADFSDVPTDETYRDGIEFLASEGIVNGYPDGTYKPKQTLNRAEMMKIIAEASESKFASYATQNCFDDVPSGQWYTQYVCYGKANGWVVGYDGGKYFRPTQTVTFVEALKITLKGFKLPFVEGDIWYQDIVERASLDNLIPHTITSFSAALQRNQMADLVARLLHSRSDTLNDYLGDRAPINVTYDTIEEGHDISGLEEVILTP